MSLTEATVGLTKREVRRVFCLRVGFCVHAKVLRFERKQPGNVSTHTQGGPSRPTQTMKLETPAQNTLWGPKKVLITNI